MKFFSLVIFTVLFAFSSSSCSSSSQVSPDRDAGPDMVQDAPSRDLPTDGTTALDSGGTHDATVPDMGNEDLSEQDNGADADPTCFQKGKKVAKLEFQGLDEVSGLAISRQQDVIWMHNDSGEDNGVFYGVGFDGSLKGTFVLDGAISRDWEDMAIAKIGEKTYLYFSDTGDNAARKGTGGRANVRVYRVEEPIIGNDDPGTEISLSTFETYTFTYPDGPTDCESLFVDPANGDLYFLEKKNSGPMFFFKLAAPVDGSNSVLEKLHSIPIGEDGYPGAMSTGGAISPDRTMIVVRTYLSILLFPWEKNESFQQATSRVPIEVEVAWEKQGEAIDFGDIGYGYGLLTISEGAGAPYHVYEDRCE